MPNTFVKIASVTVGSGGASSIDFTSIPSTYTDLCVKMSIRVAASATINPGNIRLNNSTSNYSWIRVQGNGSTASSTSYNLNIQTIENGNSSTSNTFNNVEFYIPNYAGSTYKSISIDNVTENNATDARCVFYAALWSDTSAITSIKILDEDGYNINQYSTATLYGIKSS